MSICRSAKHENAIEALKRSGLKITRPRMAVIDAFCQSDKPLNHKDIYQHILAKGEASTDLTSVYRTVEAFKKNQLIHEVQGEGFLLCQYKECEQQAHILTFCTNCKKSLEAHVPDSILSPIHWYLREQLRFAPCEHYIQLDGLCEACQQKGH